MLQNFVINSRETEMSHRHFREFSILMIMIMMFYRSHVTPPPLRKLAFKNAWMQCNRMHFY